MRISDWSSDVGSSDLGTSVFYANGAARNAVNTAISKNKQRAVVRYLKRQKAKKFTKILSGSVNYATKPIEAAYIGICHTDNEEIGSASCRDRACQDV